MRARNCLSLATGTIVSGEELFEFFYNASAYCNRNDKHKWHAILYYCHKDEENNWLDPKATYIVEHRQWDPWYGSRAKVWFRKIQEEK